MRKYLSNLFFYLIYFVIQFIAVYRLAFTIPPTPGSPGYKEYLFGTIVMSAGIGLMVIIPNLIIEYFIIKSKSNT